MPPKNKAKTSNTAKKTGEKKRGGKTQVPVHENVNEQTKESYLVEIRELDSRLTRYQVKHDELSAKNQLYQQQYDQLSSEQQETVSHYTKTLEQRIQEIADLNDRIVGSQQIKDSERMAYEKELLQLRSEYKETKDTLVSENFILATNLIQLDDFRVRRKELAVRLATLERQLQQQHASHAEDIQRLKQRQDHGKDRLKAQMIERLHEVASDFRKVTSKAMADTTKRTIAENVAIESQLTKIGDKTSEVQRENTDLQQRIVTRRRNMTQFETTQNDLAKDYISGSKLISMLKEKVRDYQQSLDKRMLMSEQCKQLQLESGVLREKLADTRNTVSRRNERHEQLTAELDAFKGELRSEKAAIRALKSVLRKSADLLERSLTMSPKPEDSIGSPPPGDADNLLQNLLEILSAAPVRTNRRHHATTNEMRRLSRPSVR